MIAVARRFQHRSGLFAATALALLSLAVATQAKPRHVAKHHTAAKHQKAVKHHSAAKHRPKVKERPVFKLSNTHIVAATWADIDGWADDDHAAAFATFVASCQAILKGTPAMRAARPMYGALYNICGKAAALPSPDAKAARAFFEQNFRPIRISPVGETDGFITGYYEPVVEGRRHPDDQFAYPLYRKPDNLLPGGRMYGATKVVVTKKHKRVSRRQLVPFYDRARIEDGVLAGRNLEICYLKDPVDAFFVHIQGSVRVKFHDGSMLRLNYVAANGQPYTAVGKYLIARNVITREDMSMERIRQWMNANPDEAVDLRRKNKSYVFFRETGLTADQQPTGAEGVSLTPGRSIAVDHRLHVYGTPFFLQAELPIDSEAPATRFRRLMIAQDTGGAIVGPARADIYWGVGAKAGVVSGRFKQPGKFVMLIPNAIDPFAVKHEQEMPLPRPRPASVLVATKADSKIIHANVTAKPSVRKLATPKKKAAPQSFLSKIFAPKTTVSKSAKPKKMLLRKPEPKKAAKKNEPKKLGPKTATPKKAAPKKPAVSKLQRKT